MSAPILVVRDLRVRHSGVAGARSRGPGVVAVDGVSLEVAAGETLAVVGESGCGKSSLARAIVRLVEPEAGSIVFEGRELTGLGPRRLQPLRRRLQLLFQEPSAALDPRRTAGEAVAEALDIHRLADRRVRRRRVLELFARVGLPPAAVDALPHQLSGGQRQRVGIARALAVEPRLVIADEPLSGLDPSVQAQIANLLAALQRGLGLSYLLISHDLRMVAHLADRVAVMYLGRIVESAPAGSLYAAPRHPYTRALLAAAGVLAGPGLEGEPPGPRSPPSGCPLHRRCPIAVARCRSERPALAPVGPAHEAACLFATEACAPDRSAAR